MPTFSEVLNTELAPAFVGLDLDAVPVFLRPVVKNLPRIMAGLPETHCKALVLSVMNSASNMRMRLLPQGDPRAPLVALLSATLVALDNNEPVNEVSLSLGIGLAAILPEFGVSDVPPPPVTGELAEELTAQTAAVLDTVQSIVQHAEHVSSSDTLALPGS